MTTISSILQRVCHHIIPTMILGKPRDKYILAGQITWCILLPISTMPFIHHNTLYDVCTFTSVMIAICVMMSISTNGKVICTCMAILFINFFTESLMIDAYINDNKLIHPSTFISILYIIQNSLNIISILPIILKIYLTTKYMDTNHITQKSMHEKIRILAHTPAILHPYIRPHLMHTP